MEQKWRWFASGFAIAMCVIGGFWASGHAEDTLFGSGLFFWLTYLCPVIFYLALAFGYLRVRDDSVTSGRWLTFLLLVCLAQTLDLWWQEWDSGALPRAAFWMFLAAALVMGFRSLAISAPGAWLRRLWALTSVLLGAGATLVVSSLFLQVTFAGRDLSSGPPAPVGWRLLLRQVRWVTAEVGLTRDINYSTTGIPSIAFDVGGYILYAAAILAALATLIWLARARFIPGRLRASRILPAIAAVTMLSALWSVSDIYWGWQFNLDRARWPAWLGFACWAGTLVFGAAVVSRLAKGAKDAHSVRALMLFQTPLAIFNLVLVPQYFADGFVPLAGLGLLLLGLQMQSWAYAALIVGRETGALSVQALTPTTSAAGNGNSRRRAAS